MSGYYGRRGGYRSRGYAQTSGRIAKPNKRPGPCRSCGEQIPAYGGHLWRESDGSWSVVHAPAEWSGSPVSGQYVGGCPGETDRLNRDGNFGGPDGARPERDRIAAVAATGAAMAASRDRDRSGGRYTYTTTGERRGGSYGRCIDAPCCGCCE